MKQRTRRESQKRIGKFIEMKSVTERVAKEGSERKIEMNEE